MEIVDYAHPTMMAEKALKEMHWAMLDNDFDKALEFGMAALVETKLAVNAIKHQKEMRDAMVKKGNS